MCFFFYVYKGLNQPQWTDNIMTYTHKNKRQHLAQS